MRTRLRRGQAAVSVLAAAAASIFGVTCATPTAGPAEPRWDLTRDRTEANPDAGARLVEVLSPSVERARQELEERLDAAFRRRGRGRPPVTPITLGELGLGARQGFSATLHEGRCYTFIAVAATDGQELDLEVTEVTGALLGRDTGAEAALELCPTRTGEVHVSVTMYRGSGPFALRLFGS